MITIDPAKLGRRKFLRQRTNAAAASIRAEGWIVRRLAPDCWKVSDHRRCTVAVGLRPATRRRHFHFNDAQLLRFAGHKG